MARPQLTKDNSSFEEWLREVFYIGGLNEFGRPYHIPYWQEEFDKGLTPKQAHASNIEGVISVKDIKE